MLKRIASKKLQSKLPKFAPYFKLLIVSCLSILGYGRAYGQKPANYDSLSYKQKMDIMFAGIKKDSLKTGILIDRVVGYSGITEIGSDSTKVDTVSEGRFLQVLFELERAIYDTNSFLSNAGDKIHAAMGRMKYSDTIPVAVIDIEYETLKDSALLNGLLRYTSDSLLESSPNDFRNPFEKHTLRLAVILESRNTIKDQGFFKIDPELCFTNTNNTFQKVKINFEAVSYELQGLGSSVKFDKNIIGSNPVSNLELKFQKNTGEVVKTSINARFPKLVMNTANIIFPCNSNPNRIIGEPFSTLRYINYVGRREFPETVVGVADVSFYLGYNDPTTLTCLEKLDKVVLVLDGFDPTDDRDAVDFYNKKLIISNTSENLGEKLRAKGYDIALVNFPDLSVDGISQYPEAKFDHGAGFMEANALAVVKVIQAINNQLRINGSNEPISIVGPSMGGIISRYALSFMEKRKAEATTEAERLLWDHKCHLYISFDAPHLGANIPIGLQEFLASESNTQEKARFTHKVKLGSPASRQLLLHHTDHSNNNGNSSYPSLYRNVFIKNLTFNSLANSGGFPSNTRKVSISNGSLTGNRQSYNNSELEPGSDFLYSTGLAINYGSIVAAINIKSLPDNNNISPVVRRWQSGGSESYIMGQQLITGGSLDLTSGGYFNAIQAARDDLEGLEVRKTPKVKLSVRNYFPIHNFIPLKSSLAFKAGINGLSEDLSTRDLVCSGEIPFDDYYVESENSEHVTISQGMADYAIAEIEGFYHQRPVKELTYSREICNNEIIDFNYTGIDFGNPNFITEITYDVSNLPFDVIPIGSAPHSQFKVRFKQDPSNPNAHFVGPWKGKVVFTLTKITSGGTRCITQLEESWHIGGPEMQATDAIELCINESKNIVLSHLPLLEQTFQISSSNPNCVGVNNLYTMVNPATSVFYAQATSSINCSCILTITGTNDCGSVQEVINASVNGNCAISDKIVKARPSIGGPLTEQIEIQVVDEEGVLAGPNVTVELSDSRGTILKSKTTNNNSIALFDATNLTVGRYVFSGKTSSGELLPKLNWFKLGSEPSVLLLSPNPAIKGVDQELVGNLLGVDVTKGPFQVKVANTNQVVLDSLKTNFLEFNMPITNLDEGLYLVSAFTNKDSLVAQEYVTLGIKARPSLRLTQNPVDDILKGYLENAVVGYENLSFRVISLGGVEIANSTGKADNFEMDVSQLLPGSYILTANDGKRVFSIQFQKN